MMYRQAEETVGGLLKFRVAETKAVEIPLKFRAVETKVVEIPLTYPVAETKAVVTPPEPAKVKAVQARVKRKPLTTLITNLS